MADQHSREEARHAGDRLPAEHSVGDPFADAFRHTRMPMIITDPLQEDNPIVFSNAAFSKLTGYSATELLGQNCRILQGPDTDRTAIAKIRDAIVAEESVSVDLLN